MYEYLCPDVPIVITNTYEQLAENEFNVYPNPADTEFNISIVPQLGQYDAVLYDLLGRPIAQWQNLEGEQNLQISGILAGYYILQVRGSSWQGTERILFH